jgi:hypothetical protein
VLVPDRLAATLDAALVVAGPRSREARLEDIVRASAAKRFDSSRSEPAMLQIGATMRVFFEQFNDPIDFDAFVRNWPMVVQLLSHRIESEEITLYPPRWPSGGDDDRKF